MSKTLSLQPEEIAILCELFSETAALEIEVGESEEVFNALWDKICQL